MKCPQWPPQLPTLKMVRLMARGFSFSFCLGSKLRSCSMSSLALSAPPHIIPDTVFTQSSAHPWDVSTGSSTDCFLDIDYNFTADFFDFRLIIFLFPLPGPFPGVEPLQERLATAQPFMPCSSARVHFFE